MLENIDILNNQDIQHAIRLKLRIKDLEVEIERLKLESNNLMVPLFIANNIKDLKVGGIGSFSYSPPGIKRTLDRDLLKIKLLEAMVPAPIISQCFEHSMKEAKSSEFVRFTPEKAKKNKQ